MRFVLLFSSLAVVSGCSASTVTDGGGSDAGLDGAMDGNDAATMDSAKDTGPVDAGLNGCAEAEFVDQSAPADQRMIKWDFNVSPRCIIIAKGQSVMWMGSFATHPLTSKGGTTPSPIVTISTGNSVSYAFSAAGDYGFICTNHQPMTGVVRVR